MRKLLLAAGLISGLALAPAAAEASFRGTVVKRDAAHKTVVVATRTGKLVIVHGTRARVGTILRVSGTHIRVVGHARHVRIKGLVTQRGLRSFSLSAGNAVVNIRLHGHHSRHPVGAGLVVHARVAADGTVTETSSDDSGDFTGAELKGTLLCIASSVDCGPSGPTPQPKTLFIDTGDPAGPIPVSYDPTSTDPDFSDATLGPLVGQQVEANVGISAPGGVVTLTLNAISAENSCTSGDDESGDAQSGTTGGGGDSLDGSGDGGGDTQGGDSQGGDSQGDNSQGDDACEGD
jgi:hypothetical protein